MSACLVAVAHGTFIKAGSLLRLGCARLSLSLASKGAGMLTSPTAQMHGDTSEPAAYWAKQGSCPAPLLPENTISPCFYARLSDVPAGCWCLLQGDGMTIDWNKVSYLISLGLQPSFCAPNCTAASVPGSLAGLRIPVAAAPAPAPGGEQCPPSPTCTACVPSSWPAWITLGLSEPMKRG